MFRLSLRVLHHAPLLESEQDPQEQQLQHLNKTSVEYKPKDNRAYKSSRKKGRAGIRGSCRRAQEPTTGGLKRNSHRVALRQGSTAGGPRSEHQHAAPRTKFELFLSHFQLNKSFESSLSHGTLSGETNGRY